MSLIISIRAIQLADGNFRPSFDLFKCSGNKVVISPYFLQEEARTKTEAKDIAKESAIEKIRRDYAPDVRVTFTEV